MAQAYRTTVMMEAELRDYLAHIDRKIAAIHASDRRRREKRLTPWKILAITVSAVAAPFAVGMGCVVFFLR
jgi:hypothetical protein